MKSHGWFAIVLLLIPLIALAQTAPNFSSASARPLSSIQPMESNTTSSTTLTGKLAVEGGSAPEVNANVILQCSGQERGRANVSHDGDFALMVKEQDSLPPNSPRHIESVAPSQHWNDCELYAEAPGYVSEHRRLSGLEENGMVSAGVIVLHPLAAAAGGGATVSAVSLAAPENAKKAFQKGKEQEKKGRWAAACDYFRRAIQAYPRYALAWLELGRSEVKQNDLSGAQQSFHQAVTEDSRFIDGYVELAKLALQQKQWKDLADATEQMVQLAPDSSPLSWFLNSAANFNLGKMNTAESSASRGLRLDGRHQVPQLEYLYAMIMVNRQDYRAAAEHLQTYLRLSPGSNDAPAAQQRLTQIQKLAPSTNPPSH